MKLWATDASMTEFTVSSMQQIGPSNVFNLAFSISFFLWLYSPIQALAASMKLSVSWDSVVGIATGYGLDE
jgi:hypothetical protein